MSTFWGGNSADDLQFGGTIDGDLTVTQDLTVGGDATATNLNVSDTIQCDTIIANTQIINEELEVKDPTITMNVGALNNTNTTALLYEFKSDQQRWSGIGRDPTSGAFYVFQDATPKPTQATNLTTLTPGKAYANAWAAGTSAHFGALTFETIEGKFAVSIKDGTDAAFVSYIDLGSINSYINTYFPSEQFDQFRISRADNTGTAYAAWSTGRNQASPAWRQGLLQSGNDNFTIQTAAGLRAFEATTVGNVVIGPQDDLRQVTFRGTCGFAKGPVTISSPTGTYTAGHSLYGPPPGNIHAWNAGLDAVGGSLAYTITHALLGTDAIKIDLNTLEVTTRDQRISGTSNTVVQHWVVTGDGNQLTFNRTGSRFTAVGPEGDLYHIDLGTSVMTIDTFLEVIVQAYMEDGNRRWTVNAEVGTGDLIWYTDGAAEALRLDYNNGNVVVYNTITIAQGPGNSYTMPLAKATANGQVLTGATDGTTAWTEPSLSWVFGWGGNVADASATGFAISQAPSTQTLSGSYASTVVRTVPVACTMWRFEWSSAQGDNTTVMDIYKNNSAFSTVTFTGARGTVSTNLSFAAGDEVAIFRKTTAGGGGLRCGITTFFCYFRT